MTPDMVLGLYALFVFACIIGMSCGVVGFIAWLVNWDARQCQLMEEQKARLVTQEWLSKTKAEYDAELRD